VAKPATPKTRPHPQTAAVEREASKPSPNHDDGRLLLLGDPLATWIAFVAGGAVLLIAVLLGAGVWAKRRVLKL
jgi:hypothetical protein